MMLNYSVYNNGSRQNGVDRMSKEDSVGWLQGQYFFICPIRNKYKAKLTGQPDSPEIFL